MVDLSISHCKFPGERTATLAGILNFIFFLDLAFFWRKDKFNKPVSQDIVQKTQNKAPTFLFWSQQTREDFTNC